MAKAEKVTCYSYNAKNGEYKEKQKKSCKGKFAATKEEALKFQEEKCSKKKKYVWADGKCTKDTKLMANALKKAGVDKKTIRKCKKAVRKGRKKLPGASIEEALNFMKDQGCDLEKIAEQAAANHQ